MLCLSFYFRLILKHFCIPLYKREIISPHSWDKIVESHVIKNGPECGPHLFGDWHSSDRKPGDVKYDLALPSHKMVSGCKRPSFRARDKWRQVVRQPLVPSIATPLSTASQMMAVLALFFFWLNVKKFPSSKAAMSVIFPTTFYISFFFSKGNSKYSCCNPYGPF
jgi:hypothetical protein